ncbi:MAG: N-acetylmuramoyl-L-alanine amidase family protein [Verrucomicrobiia bacterium]
MARILGTTFSKRTRLLVVAFWVVFLTSCQTPSDPPVDSEGSGELGRVVQVKSISEPAPVVQSKPTKPVVKPKPEAPRRAGIARQAKRVGAVAKRLDDDHWQITRDERVLALVDGSRKAELDGAILFLSEPFSRRKGFLSLSDSDFESTLVPALDPVAGTLRSNVIVIDPGHGGSEKGTTNDSLGLLEKDLNLDVSMRLQSLLEEQGYKVVLTRYDDRLVPLEERSEIANHSNAGLFVSVHFNAALNPDAMGLETYILTSPGAVSTNDQKAGVGSQAWPGNRFDSLNFELGFQTHKQLIDDLQRVDRGFKRARFKVLKGLDCPGVLVECGFVSHDKEALLLNTPVYRQKLADSLARSLGGFAKSHKGKKGS